MKRNKRVVQNTLYALLLLTLFGCNIKGANEPFSLAPSTAHNLWTPVKKAEKKPSTDFLQKELEDYEIFSKQRPISLAEIIDISLYRNPTTTKSWATA